MVCNSIMLAKSSWARATIEALEASLVKAAGNPALQDAGAAGGGAADGATLAGAAAAGLGGDASVALTARAGGLLALTYVFEALPPKNKALVHHSIVYDAAIETRQPVRTWVLHAWGTLLRQLRYSRDFGKFVQPTLALVDAHLLCDVGTSCTGAWRLAHAHFRWRACVWS
jgi:hypothetical protein